VRPAEQPTPRPRRRAFAVVAGLLIAAGALSACSDDGPPTPAISGENPADVTLPTLPPTTTEADDPSSDTTLPGNDQEGEGDPSEPTPTTQVDNDESGAPTTVAPT
jgi:hypothetical protein